MQPTMSFTLAGGPGIRITVVQTTDGKLQVTAALNPSAVVGDLRGLFFHVGDESLLGGLSVTGATSPLGTVQQGANAVSNLGGGVHMLGAAPAFDMGIVFGTASAAGADDIRSVTFTLEHATAALTLDLFSSAQFGAVIGSVGTTGGPRFGTLKATGTAPVVQSANTAPEAGNDSVTAAEDGTTVLDVLGNDSDADNDTLSISAFTQPSLGSVSLVGGALVFDAGNAFNGLAQNETQDVSFTYTVSDGKGGTDTATVTVTVVGANDAPDAVDDTFTARPNELIGSDAPGLLANDSDADGDALQVIGYDYTGLGSLTVFTDGSFSYTPAAGFVGTDSFTYTVSDGVQQDSATVTIEVVNDAPDAVDDTFTARPNELIGSDAPGLLANDTDADGDALQVIGYDYAGSGSLSVFTDGSFSYTPAPGFVGTDSFTYTVSDGVQQDTATVTIEVLNDAPDAVDDTFTARPNELIGSDAPGLLANDTDADGDALQVIGYDYAGSGSLSVFEDGSFSYTPAAGFVGTDSFTYTVSDGVQQDTATVTIEVINAAPDAVDDTFTARPNELIGSDAPGLLANDTDADGDALQVIGYGYSGLGSLTVFEDGSFSYTPAPGFVGTDSFTYTVSDGVQQDTATVTIEVVNAAPTVSDDTQTVAEDGLLDGSVAGLADDVDGDGLTFALVGGGLAGLTFNEDGSYSYVPPADFNGTVSFDFAANDGTADSNTGTVTIEVTPVNDAPTDIALSNASVQENSPNGTLVGLLSASDIDSAAFAFSIIGGPVPFAIVGNELRVNGALDFEMLASYSVTIRANDGAGGTFDETFTVSVTDVDETPNNTPPVANGDSTTIGENVGYDFWHYVDVVANDTDVDNDSLFVTAVTVLNGAPAVAEIWSDTQIRFYVDDPNNDWNGEFQLQYTVSDGNGGTAMAIVDVTVTPENDRPLVANDFQQVAEDGLLSSSVAGLADDVDGDDLTFALVGGGLVGLTFNDDGSYSYAPPADFNGTVSFQFTASDGTVESPIGTVTITVTPVNDAPTVENDAQTVAEDGLLDGSVAGLAEDVDGDGVTFALVGGGLVGLTFNDDGSYSYAPPADFNGSVSFDFVANDGTADSNTGTVTISVTPINDAPTVDDDARTVAEDGLLDGSVAGLADDVDGDSLTFALVGGGLVGLTFNDDGSYSYAPPADFNGTVSFDFVANDGTANSNTGTVTIEVTPVNDAPTDIALSNASVQENSPNGTLVGLLSASDIDSAAFAFSIIGGPVPFAIVGNELRVNGALDFETLASYSVTIRANDGAGGTFDETFTVSVTDVDETPNNTPPTVGDDSQTIDEDGVLNGSVVGLASDADNDALTFALVSTTPAGLSFNPDGSYTYDAPDNFNGQVTFDFVASDGQATSNQGTVTITVNAVNDVPTAPNGVTRTVNEDTSILISAADLIAGATDADGDTIVVSGVTSNAFVTGTLEAGGIRVIGTLNTNGAQTITYQLSDGNGGFVDGLITLDITPVNDRPVVTPTTFQGTEDVPFVIAISDLLAQVAFDVDVGDTVSFLNVTGDFGGAVTIGGGNLTFTPLPNRDSAGSFFLSVTDGQLNAGGTITINLASVNDAPVAGDDVVARTASPQVITFATLFANDVDVDTAAANRTISAITNESGVTVAVNNAARTLTVTYDPAHVGAYGFDYTVSDGAGGFDTATVTLNTVPVANNDATTIGENNGWTDYHFVNVIGNDSDADGDLLTVFSAVALNGAPIVVQRWDSNSDGRFDSLRFYVDDPSNNTNGVFQVQYTVSDQRGGTDTAVVTINVTPEDDAPIVRPDLQSSEIVSTSQFTPVYIPFATLLANDEHPDGTDFTITSVQTFMRGSAALVDTNGDLVNDSVRFTPDANTPLFEDFGSSWLAYFHYTVTETNGDGDTASTYAFVRVFDVNENPSAVDDTVTRTGANPQVISYDTLFGNDVDWDSPESGWTISAITNQNGVTAVADNVARTVTVTYQAGFGGTYGFDYTLDDGEGGTSTATVTLNTAPVANNDATTIAENTAWTFYTNVNVIGNDGDADGDLLTVTVVTPLNGAPVIGFGHDSDNDGRNESVRFYIDDPLNDTFGTFEVQYTVSDGGGGTDTAVLTITVTPENDAPRGVVENAGVFTTLEDTAIVIPVAALLANGDYDPDGDAFWIESVTEWGSYGGDAVLDDKGTADRSDDEVVFTPDANFNGNAYFYYVLEDVFGARDLNTYAYVTVTPVNDPVTANDDVIARLFPESGTQTITRAQLLGNDADVDGDGAITGVVAGANVSSIVLNADQSVTVTYTSGAATFTYTLSDGTFSDTALVTLNSGPRQTGTPGVLNLTEDAQSYFTDDQLIALAGVTDPNGDNLFISGYGTNPNISVSGGFWWNVEENWLTPAPQNFNGPTAFTFTISDGNAATDLTVTLDVLVAAVDDPAVAVDDLALGLVTNEETGIVIQIAHLLANDFDVEGDPFAAIQFFTQAWVGGAGSVVNNGNGTITYTPGTNVAEGYNPYWEGNIWSGGYGGPGFFYRVTGGDTAFVRVTVNNTNDPVVAGDDFVARLPGAPASQDVTYLQMTGNDDNPDPNGVLTIISVQNAVNGTAVLNDNGTPGNPTDDFVTFTHGGGVGSFQYTVREEGGTTSTATVYFNGAPVAQPDAVTVSETEATYAPDGNRRDISIDRTELVGNDVDPEGQLLYIAAPVFSSPEWRWDTSVISSVSYFSSSVVVRLIDPDWSGETWFEYRARDFGNPNAFSEPVRVTLTVEDGNDAPLSAYDYWWYNGTGYGDTNPASNDMVGYEDSILDIPVSRLLEGQFIDGTYQQGADFDEEDEALSIDPASLTSFHGTVQIVDINGEQFVRFTPRGDLNGELQFTYAATDGTTTGTSTPVYVYILPVNDAPIVSDGEIPVPIGQTEYFISFAQLLTFVSDEDHSDFDLAFLDALGVSGGSVDIEADGIRFLADGSGDPLQFEFSYEDPEGASDSGVITLIPTEAPPVVLYFQGYDYQTGFGQLWHYVPGNSPFVSVALQEIDGNFSYYPFDITPFGDGIVFRASTSSGEGLYAYSEVGGLVPLVIGDYIQDILVVGDSLYAASYDNFYVFGPGTPEGQVPEGGYSFQGLTEGPDGIYFIGRDDMEGWEQIFRYDPTSQTITQLTSFADGSVGGIRDLAVTADGVFFVADRFDAQTSDWQNGLLHRLDMDDETVDGDGQPIGALSWFGWSGMAEDPYVRELVAVGEQVYFIAGNDADRDQLWRADDSGAGVVVYDNSSGYDGWFNAVADDYNSYLVAFQDGVLANFYDADSGGNYHLFFGNAAGFAPVDDFNYSPGELRVVDGEAFYIAYDGNEYGQEVFVFDGDTVQRLTTHDASYYMNELEVLSRDRIFITSSDSGGEGGGSGNAVYEYNPGEYGDTFTHRLEREGAGIAYSTLTAADGGLYFTLSVNGSGFTYFASYSAFFTSMVDGFALSSNGDRGFFGDMPLASFNFGEGAEATFFNMTSPVDFVDIAPGPEPGSPASPASSSPSGFVQLEQAGAASVADIYAIATIPQPGPDSTVMVRISYDEVTGTRSVDQVAGLTAVGNPPNADDLREYLFQAHALGDVVLVTKGIYDPTAFQYDAFELWLVEGLTATMIDTNAGYLFDTEVARAGDVLFYEDQFTAGAGAELTLYDLATGTSILVDINAGAESSDPRELVAAGGGVYMRAVTEGIGFAGDIELVRVETDGSFTVIDLRDDAEAAQGAAPRQITAVDADTVVVFGDTDAGPTLWSVTGTTVEFSIGLWASGVAGVPFLEGGTEVYNGGLFFFADTWSGQGTQLFRYDIASQDVQQITSGNASGRDPWAYSMEVAGGVLWFVFDEGYGDGLELYYYDESSWGALTNLDQGSGSYEAYGLAAIAAPDILIS